MADSYEFSYVNPQTIAMNTPTGGSAPSKDYVRGILAVERLIESYPSMNFKESPIAKEDVLTTEILERFGMDHDWYL